MYRIIRIVSLVLVTGLSTAQITKFGPCPEVTTKTYFDLQKFLGTWFEIERFPTWYEESSSCGSKKIQQCGRKIEIVHSFLRDGVEYVMHMNSTYTPGDEAVFVIQKNSIDPMGISLSVIETDYDNYALVYGCKYNETLNFKYMVTWILSRDRALHEDFRQTARGILNNIPYANVAYLETVYQSTERCTEAFYTAHVQADEYEEAK